MSWAYDELFYCFAWKSLSFAAKVEVGIGGKLVFMSEKQSKVIYISDVEKKKSS